MPEGALLLLGGTGEARRLAQALSARGRPLIYSIAGLVRRPELACEIHCGGFSRGHADGAAGMAAFCRARNTPLIIDATHPYAQRISANAAAAAAALGIPCWRLERPAWRRGDYPLWQDYDQLEALLPRLAPYARPFLSVGRGALALADRRPAGQTWIVRCARPCPARPGIISLSAIGPFALADELALLRAHKVDALVTKNSGGAGTEAKMTAAKMLGLPSFVQRRPPPAAAHRRFASVAAALSALG